MEVVSLVVPVVLAVAVELLPLVGVQVLIQMAQEAQERHPPYQVQALPTLVVGVVVVFQRTGVLAALVVVVLAVTQLTEQELLEQPIPEVVVAAVVVGWPLVEMEQQAALV